MASKQKGKQAAQQAASQPVVSVDKANDRNMTVLRRIDPQLEEVGPRDAAAAARL
jgi:hypothetical protein